MHAATLLLPRRCGLAVAPPAARTPRVSRRISRWTVQRCLHSRHFHMRRDAGYELEHISLHDRHKPWNVRARLHNRSAVPAGILYCALLSYYRRTSRAMQRIEAVQRAPAYALLSEALAGVAPLRSAHLIRKYVKAMAVLCFTT